MKIKLKTKPQSKPDSTSTNSNNSFEQKTISELVNVLRGTCQFDTYDTIEGVLVNRDMRLKTEKLQLEEKLQMEVHLRKQAEEEVKKREELCKKGKRVKECYETLLKEVKRTRLPDRNMIQELRKKNNELECELKILKEKFVDGGNKEKLVEDGNELDVLRKMVGGLENEVLELTKLNEKLVEDNNALDELRGKVRVLEGDKNALVAGHKIQIGELEERVKNLLVTTNQYWEENCKLAGEKRKFEKLYNSLETVYRELQERVSKLKEAELLMNVDASGGGNNERERHADPMVADFVNVFGNDTVEAAPLRRNEDVHDSLGVAASTQPQNIGGNDTQGASSASGRVKPGKDSEIIILDNDDGDRSISQRVHGKKTTFGLAVKDANPSSSVATQQKSKFTNAVVDTPKRKFSFFNIEPSSDDSSDDSFLDNLPISTVLSRGKKTKN